MAVQNQFSLCQFNRSLLLNSIMEYAIILQIVLRVKGVGLKMFFYVVSLYESIGSSVFCFLMKNCGYQKRVRDAF